MDPPVGGNDAQADTQVGDQPIRGTKRKAKVVKEKKAATNREPAACWDHFDKTEAKDTEDGIQRATCKYCRTVYLADPKIHGVSTLTAHMNRCKKYPYRNEKGGQQTLNFQHKKDGQEGLELVATTFTIEAARNALVEMIIIDELPFRFVEGVGFKRFCNIMQPKFKNIPSRFTIARDVVKIFNREREKLRNLIQGRRVCLTTDTWTSIQNLNYMCLTAHFVGDDWKLHKRILNFCQVEDHKGETIGREIERCIIEWNIGSVFTLTVDNASSNSTTIKYLAKKTKDWEGTILEHEFLHVRCCAHILNLIVCDGLKELDSSIVCIREVVRYVRSSPNRLEAFKICAKKEKIESKKYLCLDVPTRWNSTYLMLDAAHKFEKVFDRFHDKDSSFKSLFKDDEVSEGEDECNEHRDIGLTRRSGANGGNGPSGGSVVKRKPNKKDWNNCRLFVQFLRLFYLATKRFSGTLYVTSNVFFADMFVIQTEIYGLLKTNDMLLFSMAKSMKEKLEKYWGKGDKINLLLYVAVVLDPRNKLDFVEFAFTDLFDLEVGKEMSEKVKSCLIRLFDDYAKRYSMNAKSYNVGGVSPMNVDDECNDPHKALASRFNSFMDQRSSNLCKTEVEKYLAESREQTKDPLFDILRWWKENSGKYKVLSLVARDVLAFPVSTVASESAFSTGGRILDPFRSSLSPKMVEMLVCGQNWLQNYIRIDLGKSMDYVEQFEEYELELAEEVKSQNEAPVQLD